MKRSGFKRPSYPDNLVRSQAARAEASAATEMTKARKASAERNLRKIERIAATAANIEGSTTGWESDFLVDVTDRLQRYGRAFADPEKGNTELALSFRQSRKLREIYCSVRRKVHQD